MLQVFSQTYANMCIILISLYCSNYFILCYMCGRLQYGTKDYRKEPILVTKSGYSTVTTAEPNLDVVKTVDLGPVFAQQVNLPLI